jgi:hypothetical protein
MSTFLCHINIALHMCVVAVAVFSMNEIFLLQQELQTWYSVFRRENRRLVWNAVTEAMEEGIEANIIKQ